MLTFQKLVSLLMLTLLSCAEPCPRGAGCSDDACGLSHPPGKMFCKLTHCKGGRGRCHAPDHKADSPPGPCRYLHQCPHEKGGRKRCHNQHCKYDHINNITINQARQVVRQVGGTCQSHALAAWLVNWIETSSDPAYRALAHSFRCKAKGHRLYDVLVRRFSADFDDPARPDRGRFNDWLERMLTEVIPAGRVHVIEANRRWGSRSDQVAHVLKNKDMPLIFVMRTTSERMGAFQEISSFGDQTKDEAFQRFWNLPRLKDARAENPDVEVGAHAMLCCPDPNHGGFAIKNSWGKQWAQDGIVYFRPWRCDEDSDFTFHQIEIPDHAPLNGDFFSTCL